jgi:hypothetical protein
VFLQPANDGLAFEEVVVAVDVARVIHEEN